MFDTSLVKNDLNYRYEGSILYSSQCFLLYYPQALCCASLLEFHLNCIRLYYHQNSCACNGVVRLCNYNWYKRETIPWGFCHGHGDAIGNAQE